MKTLNEVEPRIPINSDNTPGDISYEYVISSSGSYYLTGDVTTTKGGISVAADDVTIDLMGYTLKGSDSGTNSGIYTNARSNVEIRNGTVRDFRYGIYQPAKNGQGHRVINVRAISNVHHGIYLSGKDHLVKDCTASYNGDNATSTVYGIRASSGCTVTGNTAYNNGYNAGHAYGIYASTGSTVTGNTAYNNGDYVTGNAYGIYLTGNNLADQNTAYNNGSSAGSATNMYAPGNCTLGTNHAPQL